MTINEFLKDLEYFKADWLVNQLGLLRTVDGYCPVCFLAMKKGVVSPGNKVAYYYANRALGLSDMDATIIANSADSNVVNAFYDSGIRQKLIEITGVK